MRYISRFDNINRSSSSILTNNPILVAETYFVKNVPLSYRIIRSSLLSFHPLPLYHLGKMELVTALIFWDEKWRTSSGNLSLTFALRIFRIAQITDVGVDAKTLVSRTRDHSYIHGKSTSHADHGTSYPTSFGNQMSWHFEWRPVVALRYVLLKQLGSHREPEKRKASSY